MAPRPTEIVNSDFQPIRHRNGQPDPIATLTGLQPLLSRGDDRINVLLAAAFHRGLDDPPQSLPHETGNIALMCLSRRHKSPVRFTRYDAPDSRKNGCLHITTSGADALRRHPDIRADR
ncbi:hypothetical protein [Amorphus sp. 3PC139-8]|uniref:hypothetical protein n=1 Tax=Amorphus sp. 3PC139-8 TaxID=2735676 RepID=UPI00345DE65A